MTPVPWSWVRSWYCSNCGLCCREFEVVLRFDEWLRMVQRYGVGVTKAGLDKFYMGKKDDRTCLFLYNSLGRWFCGLQHMKPVACRLWPFKISNRPTYGRPKEAVFNYGEKQVFVYIDPICPEIAWGQPSPQMLYRVIPELVEIAMGIREKQVYSTSSIYPPHRFVPSTRREGRLLFP